MRIGCIFCIAFALCIYITAANRQTLQRWPSASYGSALPSFRRSAFADCAAPSEYLQFVDTLYVVQVFKSYKFSRIGAERTVVMTLYGPLGSRYSEGSIPLRPRCLYSSLKDVCRGPVVVLSWPWPVPVNWQSCGRDVRAAQHMLAACRAQKKKTNTPSAQ